MFANLLNTLGIRRNDPGGELTSSRVPRARSWVTTDGAVLQQELTLMSARLSFVRMADDSDQLANMNLWLEASTESFGSDHENQRGGR